MKRHSAVECCRIAIIGGGFSGLIASSYLHSLIPSAEITIYESLARAGKKILVTGNGRCNLTNRDVSPSFYQGDTELFRSVYCRADNSSMLSFFENIGLVCREDFSGRYYPVSNQASSVLDVLMNQVKKDGTEIITDCRIVSLEKKNGMWCLNGQYYADAVLFAAGGKAAPVQGSDGTGLSLLSSLGIRITALSPSLVPLYIKGFTKSLKGIRAQGCVTIKDGGRVLASDTGEIQYTDYGISGIPVFQVSAAASRIVSEGRTVTAVVDSAPFMSFPELQNYISQQICSYPSAPAENILSGIMPKKLGAYFLRESSLSPEKPAPVIFPGAVKKLAHIIKSSGYTVTGTGSFRDAQVTAGGILTEEMNTDTLEIKKLGGVFACGEILDVDGLCGGYNLQWAYSSAVAASYGIAKELTLASDK